MKFSLRFTQYRFDTSISKTTQLAIMFVLVCVTFSVSVATVDAGQVTVQQSYDRSSQSPLEAPRDPKKLTTNLQGFGVPFSLDANQEGFIEVQLYLSKDKGRTWAYHARAATDEKEFPFRAEADGEYWFALKTLNRDRRLIPSGDPQPELKIVVDTAKPKLDFRVQADNSGRVICRWQATDPNLLPKSLKIFYQPIRADGSRKPWLRVPVSLNGVANAGIYSDQIGWWPETNESLVNVAVEIQDAAGNTTRADRRITLTQAAWRNRNVATARPRVNDGRTRVAKPGGPPPQPEWARPDWLPPQNVASQKDVQPKNQHPEGMICENGVCRPSGSNDAPIRSASISQTQLPLGWQEEYVDPPVPPGYVPPVERVAQNQSSAPSNHSKPPTSQLWQSESQDVLPKRQLSTSSTTRRIDPTIIPRDPEAPSSPSTFVPSNPSRMRIEGNQVISQSSTKGPQNQYRGGNSMQQSIAQPELLPNNQSNDTGWSPRASKQQTAAFPTTSAKPIEERSGGTIQRIAPKPQPSSKSNFSNVGFKRQPSPHPATALTSEKPLRKTNAPAQIIGSKRFRLNYGVDSIDPSGVGKVDLWITKDDGKTWNNWGSDPDNRSPFPVEIETEGRYGFRIVVQSKDGLTSPGPASGDDADMWITIDTQSPLARIKSVPFGNNDELQHLIINYAVSDTFLTLRPITLAYAANPDGPWQIIETGVRNNGRYAWKPTQDVPDKIFLRIEAIDRAGNVGRHTLSQSIDISGLRPRGTIHGVTPVVRQ